MESIKSWFLLGAELVDAYRIFPRIFLLLYISIVYDSSEWYRMLEAPTGDQTNYIQWMWGAATAITGFYVATGRKWGS